MNFLCSNFEISSEIFNFLIEFFEDVVKVVDQRVFFKGDWVSEIIVNRIFGSRRIQR